MSDKQENQRPSIISSAAISIAAGYVAFKFAPIIEYNILYPIPTIAFVISAVNGINLLAAICEKISKYCEYTAETIPVNYKASAEFATRKEVAFYSHKYGWGAYWGVYAGSDKRRKPQEIIASYESNAVTFGAAGSGKGVGVVIPNVMATRDSKIVFDFKTTNAVMLKPALEARGERVVVTNIGGLYENILGCDSYNPMDLICDNYLTAGFLENIPGDCAEFAHQFYPEPPEGGEDAFFREGSREMIMFCLQHVALIYGRKANLGHVEQMLSDKDSFLKDALWASGELRDAEGNLLPAMPLEKADWVKHHNAQDVKNYIQYFRSRAKKYANMLQIKDNRTAESFLSGAQQAMSDFNIVGRASKTMQHSSFRFADLKEGGQPTTIFLSMDASRLKSQNKILALLQFCSFMELKRHPNKECPVYIEADETTNAIVHGLDDLLTWGREYGIRIHMYIQSLGAFRKAYGKDAESSLLSQCEIIQFLPGQKDEMANLIEKMMGDRSYVGRSNSGKFHGYDLTNCNLSEDIRPLMTADEIRRTHHTILFIRNSKPILTRLIPYSAIYPWRNSIVGNPMKNNGKPWKLPIKLRLKRGYPSILRRTLSFITGGLL